MRLIAGALIFLLSNSLHAAQDATPGEAWAGVLQRHVDSHGRIDFHRLRDNDEPLRQFVTWLAEHGPQQTPERFPRREDVLAYHINAYNALAMHGVLERGIPKDFGSFFKRARFFRFRAITVDGTRTNLYDYENDIIRPLGEPRVHFALNCMVRDCPRLPRVPFSGDELETQLEAAAMEFFNNEKYVRVDVPAKVVRVSAILDFYTEDFTPDGRAQDLITYLNRFRRDAVSEGFRLRFLDYDWTVNQQP